MANIGKPIKRHQVVPLDQPIQAPEGPVRREVEEPSQPNYLPTPSLEPAK